MLPRIGGSAENSQSAAPGKPADNPQTVGFCLYKASFIFGYVGNLTDSAPQVGAEWDPETIQSKP
jgi:hypothetical protein